MIPFCCISLPGAWDTACSTVSASPFLLTGSPFGTFLLHPQGSQAVLAPEFLCGKIEDQQPIWFEEEREKQKCMCIVICKKTKITSFIHIKAVEPLMIPTSYPDAALSTSTEARTKGYCPYLRRPSTCSFRNLTKTLQFFLLHFILVQYPDTHLLLYYPVSYLHCSSQYLNLFCTFLNLVTLSSLDQMVQKGGFHVWFCSPILKFHLYISHLNSKAKIFTFSYEFS